jgi:ABC-2 type transport system ATP-binding protein
MIHVENLTKDFKSPKKYPGFFGAFRALISLEQETKRAVDNMSFDIAPGEMVGYIGVNGAGKSTTIKMLSGILVPSGGRCVVNGRDPFRERKANSRDIGVVFGQRTQLWWDLPLSESFSILRRIYDIPKPKFDENLAYFRELFSLDEFFLTPVRNLSLGQKMRADLTASMLHEPKVLFLDEPTIGLDILVKDRIRKAIREINAQKNTTVILTTHDLGDIEEICDRIIVIDQGRKIFDGDIRSLKARYGRIRELRLVVREETPAPSDFASELGVPESAIQAEYTEGEVKLRFDREAVVVQKLIAVVVARYDVKDIVIEEVEMEEIVKEIYAGKLG